ncbi:MAG: UvrD-helicase domain-containing protein [Coleofasciculus sp. S288]|nr:UvrD-helicase domain-containing protein [Coleofasciculus sp. S288]
MKLKPSTYQTAIIKAVEENLAKPIKNGITVNALAGSGKSTLLVMIANVLKRYGIRPEEVAVLAFGNKNKADLSKKFQEKLGTEWSESVRTIHSLGYQLYRDALFVRHKLVKIQDWKYARIAERKGWMTDKNGFVGKLVENDIPAIRDEQEFIRLLELLRLYCYEPTTENVAALNGEYRLSIINNEVVAQAAKECLEAGEDEAIFRYIIDRVDMCYLPWKQKDNSPFSDVIAKLRRQLKVIMVDESQDTDQLQIELIASLIEPGQSFIIAVGDHYQSVYHFRGCLNNGMEILGKRFNCINFDLPINYRCGQVHLELVREIFPHIHILARPDAPTGEIRVISNKDLEQEDHLIYVSLTRVLANGSDESGILYLVLREREDGVMFPSWLPEKYCQLWNFN